MIYFEIKNNNGKIVSSNMNDFSLKNNFTNNKNFLHKEESKKIKGLFEVLDGFEVWVVIENEPDLFSSQKLFKKTFKLYKQISLDVYSQYKKEISAYGHTLNTIQAQMRQKIDDFSGGDDFYADSYNSAMEKVSDVIDENKNSASDLILYMQKRTVDMRAQLLGSEIIHSGEQYEIKQSTVRLKRAILNQCTPFFEEFDKKNVKIKIFFEDECYVDVDKNMFSLVMYNFLSNSLKYTKNDSDIKFNYDNETKRLDISMISLRMERSEINNLFKEGERGLHSNTIPGKGIGLFVIQEALKLMNKKPMYIEPNYQNNYIESNLNYVENHFQFSL